MALAVTPDTNPLETLRSVTVAPRVIEGFRPLAQSLEWGLSDLYWNTQGLSGFVSNEVPYLVNNSGSLSASAAEVLYANCVEAPGSGAIRVLELGSGSGLFARYLLDEFQRLCQSRGADFFDRLQYYVSDRSRRTVEQWSERELFARDAGRAIPCICDALDPAAAQTLDGQAIALSGLRAIFANYVLDSLPAAILRKGENGPEQLCVRTHLTGDQQRIRQYTTLDLDALRALAASPDPVERAQLIPLMPLFEFEPQFQPCLPLADWASQALNFGQNLDRILVNYGACQCIERCLALLETSGFVLINDYGAIQFDQIAGQASSQRFGSSTAVGLNFPLIEHHFTAQRIDVIRPDGDEHLPVHPRLIPKPGLGQTRQAFLAAFDGNQRRINDAPVERARKHIEAGRMDQAKEEYQAALRLRPRDWHLIGEVAEFVIRQLAAYEAGLQLARSAVALNPWHGVWLWNVLGDVLFVLDRSTEAHEAYLYAQKMEPGDVRTCLNLGYTYAQAGRYQEALQALATGLANDRNALFRERLIEKQQHILAQISARFQSEQEWLARRAARLR